MKRPCIESSAVSVRAILPQRQRARSHHEPPSTRRVHGGAAAAGDGCNACEIENGFTCTGEPSECSTNEAIWDQNDWDDGSVFAQ